MNSKKYIKPSIKILTIVGEPMLGSSTIGLHDEYSSEPQLSKDGLLDLQDEPQAIDEIWDKY